MARYTGPKTKKARSFGEAIYGASRAFDRRKYGPGQHGPSKRRKQKSDYAIQLMEKQKAKFTYGILERQFRNTFEKASRKGGVTGEVLLQFLEARLDNTVFRLGIAPTRRAARQLVNHRHICVNGVVSNIPSIRLSPGDVISIRGRSKKLEAIQNSIATNSPDAKKWNWLEWNQERLEGNFLGYPERAKIPEKINEQLIVELYSK